jgi:multiple sugar transport system permease protein
VLAKASLYLVVGCAVLFVIAPVLWIVLQSFQVNDQLTRLPPSLRPFDPFYINYRVLLTGDIAAKERGLSGATTPDAVKWLKRTIVNSAVVSLTTAVLAALCAMFTGYTLSRSASRLASVGLIAFLALRMLPPIGMVVPIYLILRWAGLIDTLLGLVITYTAFVVSYNIWIFHSFFQTIPLELEDAARIDGCSRLQSLLRVVLPLSLPAIGTVLILDVLMSWNEFSLAVVISKSQASFTLPVILSMLSEAFMIKPYDLLLAGSVVGLVLPIALVVVFQDMFVSGLTEGATR